MPYTFTWPTAGTAGSAGGGVSIGGGGGGGSVPPPILPVPYIPPPPGPTSTGALLATPEYTAAQDYLHELFNPVLSGPNWDALLAAAAVGEAYNQTNARLAFNQLFRSTADGQYLDRRFNDYGVRRPDSVGMGDGLFRSLGTILTNDALTNRSLWQVLEVFYGTDAIRPSITSTVPEPYTVLAGDTLSLLVDDKFPVSAVFRTADFVNPAQATALEVSAVLTRFMRLAGQKKAYAAPYTSPLDGKNYVRIYSGALGAYGAVRPQGGRLQNVLAFPTPITRGGAATQWSCSLAPATGCMHLAFTGGTDPGLDGVLVGDFVCIYGPTFSPGNRGTFTITKLYLDGSTSPRTGFIEFYNPAGVTETVVTGALNDLAIHRATRSALPVAKVWSADPTKVVLRLPATTQAVSRTNGTGSYPHVAAPLQISSLVRTAGGAATVTTTTPHGLVTGGVVLLDGVIPNGGVGGGGLNGLFSITVQGATTFTFSTPDAPYATSASLGAVTPVAAPAQTSIQGPYLRDPVSGLAISNVSSAVQTTILRNQQSTILTLANASAFPDSPGLLLFGYGTRLQSGPVAYAGRISSTQLLLDPRYIFGTDVPVGTTVTLLSQRGPPTPLSNTYGGLYATATPAGRAAAEAILFDTIAAGLPVQASILYPGDRGLGGEGCPTTGVPKLSDTVTVWAGDATDSELAFARSS